MVFIKDEFDQLMKRKKKGDKKKKVKTGEPKWPKKLKPRYKRNCVLIDIQDEPYKLTPEEIKEQRLQEYYDIIDGYIFLEEQMENMRRYDSSDDEFMCNSYSIDGFYSSDDEWD